MQGNDSLLQQVGVNGQRALQQERQFRFAAMAERDTRAGEVAVLQLQLGTAGHVQVGCRHGVGHFGPGKIQALQDYRQITAESAQSS